MSFEPLEGIEWCTTHSEPIDECNDNICRGRDPHGEVVDCEIVALYFDATGLESTRLKAENERLRNNLQAIAGGGG